MGQLLTDADTDAATANRELLRLLACGPDPYARGPAVRAVAKVTRSIREAVVGAHCRGQATVSVSTLRCWHDELETALGLLADGTPEAWRRWLRPGTWLDQLLRLRLLLGQLCSSADERGASSVSYAKMNITSHLWLLSTKDGGTDDE